MVLFCRLVLVLATARRAPGLVLYKSRGHLLSLFSSAGCLFRLGTVPPLPSLPHAVGRVSTQLRNRLWTLSGHRFVCLRKPVQECHGPAIEF